jgi:small subunit ribosomal protein S6
LKSYEAMVIIRPDIPEDLAKKVVEGISSEISKIGGKIAEHTLSPKQRLSYTIAKHNDGYCLCLRFEAKPTELENLTQRFSLNQDILRHLITKRNQRAPRAHRPRGGMGPACAPASSGAHQ